MDEYEYLLGAGSLYNPKDDKRYSDLVGPQKDFDFAADLNKGFSDYYQRENAAAIAERNQMVVEQEKRKREAMTDPDVIDGLANARSEEEVASIMKQAAIKSGDYETLQKLQNESTARADREPKRKADLAKSIESIAERDPEEAMRMWEETFGSTLGPDAFKKKPKLQNVGGEIVTIDEDTLQVTPVYKPKKERTGTPKYDVWYDEQGDENYYPEGQLPPKGSGLKKSKPEKSLQEKIKEKVEMEKALNVVYDGGNPISQLTNAPQAERQVQRFRRKSPSVTIGQK